MTGLLSRNLFRPARASLDSPSASSPPNPIVLCRIPHLENGITASNAHDGGRAVEEVL